MSNIQSVIVYRNSIEAAFWESGMIFPLFLGLIVALVIVLAVNGVLTLYNRSKRISVFNTPAWQGYMIVASAIVAMLSTMFLFS